MYLTCLSLCTPLLTCFICSPSHHAAHAAAARSQRFRRPLPERDRGAAAGDEQPLGRHQGCEPIIRQGFIGCAALQGPGIILIVPSIRARREDLGATARSDCSVHICSSLVLARQAQRWPGALGTVAADDQLRQATVRSHPAGALSPSRASQPEGACDPWASQQGEGSAKVRACIRFEVLQVADSWTLEQMGTGKPDECLVLRDQTLENLAG
eukprot:scaffold90950_cov16-Tisochrysis_lutea.AAC.1